MSKFKLKKNVDKRKLVFHITKFKPITEEDIIVYKKKWSEEDGLC
jgi:hypothetical protein